MPRILHGIDIGGTKVGVCIGDELGRIRVARQFPTDHNQSPAEILKAALDLLMHMHHAGNYSAPRGLGVAVPGPYHAGTQAFLDPPNMPRWHGFELGKFLRDHSALPSHAMNDANAGVLAEHRWGAGVGARNVIFFTMGTGMGAGFVLDGHVYEGTDGFAAEIGHLQLEGDGPVGFGRRGSVEGYLSGPGMVQVAQAERLICQQTGERSALLDLPEPLTPEQVCVAARNGDAAALRAVDRCAVRLGRLMALLTDILNPQVFILGTIGTAFPDLFIPKASEVLRADAIRAAANIVRVVPSGLRDRSNQQALAAALTLL